MVGSCAGPCRAHGRPGKRSTETGRFITSRKNAQLMADKGGAHGLDGCRPVQCGPANVNQSTRGARTAQLEAPAPGGALKSTRVVNPANCRERFQLKPPQGGGPGRQARP